MKPFRRYLLLVLLALFSACSSSSGGHSVDPADVTSSFVFTESGTAFPSDDLIDLEFLPGTDGELIVIGQSGTVYYVDAELNPLAQTAIIDVLNSGEQGLLNVEADPDYDANHYIYLYYTATDGSQNQVDRVTVTADAEAGEFSLSDQQTIISFSKDDSDAPGENHNGGGMAFDEDGNLCIGVGDGGGSSSSDVDEGIGQNSSSRLGKILRIVPEKTASTGGFSIPEEGNGGEEGALEEIYSLGVRNPFTLSFGNDTLFIGNVGAGSFEEIDAAATEGLNFGWPDSEGETDDAGITSPLHGYAHNDDTFISEDSDPGDSDSRAIMVLSFYDGDQYDGQLNDRLLYTDFYLGWVRGLQLDGDNAITDDDHIAHVARMTALKEGPDGFLFGVSLYGSDHLLRLEEQE